MRHQAITISDVAARAGVSSGTASKALSGTGQLRRQTRDRVVAAARELGYLPNTAARSLMTGRSFVVGVLTTDSIGRFTIPLLAGAEDVLGAGQISMLLCESRGDNVRERHYLQTLLARRVDGIIVTGRSSDARPTIGRDLPIPVVYALCRSTDDRDITVTHDDAGGAALAVRHLVDTGRRHIAVVSGPARHAATTHRAEGAIVELRAHSLEPAWFAPDGQWSEEWGREAAARLLRTGTQVDGVFCMSDQIGRGFLDGLRDARRLVPEEIAVVGMDNWDAMAASARPPLTTIDLQLARIGELAATLLLRLIDGAPVEAGLRTVDSRLVGRRSTSLVNLMPTD